MTFTKKEILDELDLAFDGIPGKRFPVGKEEDVKYNFFPDLEHGYCETAGSKIHLYADAANWAIVFEKSGYQNRGGRAEIELNYFGNCIEYTIETYPERNYISNTQAIVLIDGEEFERIQNTEGGEMETFELIDPDIKEIKVRDTLAAFDNNYKNYEKLGIKIRDFDNPRKLIGFGDLIRYYAETDPEIVAATAAEIKKNIPEELPKLITLEEFYFSSAYDKDNPPSSVETYKLIAKILVAKDTGYWKPTLEPNNNWKNWESGNL
ncbi:DUF7003 family protein [Niabella beijingensis]|uniref:DUF7003 family protein n=1 Tax=Niabella beijingensis TaxID=2872700 RepID=UPI001CBE1A85|nr:hypothetical protein [Niabella beijingensis]MBZ4188071.1 hypothetical protein [Niabella beijingensis]